ncbi:MAG: PEP-utilizing enzyme [Nanoarchaeota archaeon]
MSAPCVFASLYISRRPQEYFFSEDIPADFEAAGPIPLIQIPTNQDFENLSVDSLEFQKAALAERKGLEELREEIEKALEQKRKTEKKKKELFVLLSEEVKEYASILMELGHDRLQLKNCWSGAELLALPLFTEIAERINVPVEDFFAAYTEEDIEAGLLYGTKLDEEEMRKRKQAMLYHVDNGIVTFKTGEEAEKEINNLLGAQNFSEQKEVKGMVANSGSISGRVRIVLIEDIEGFQKALNEFEEGEILVTTMTSPNMVPLIEKAAGIITNEGGICSHAAIIAREVTTPRKKPCVVGTKDATRIFKTGDYVLIEGETGTIMKIQKEEHEKKIEDLQRELEIGGN